MILLDTPKSPVTNKVGERLTSLEDENERQTRHIDLSEVIPQVWIVAAALALAIIVLIVAAFLAWRVSQTPFPGFFVEPTLVANGLEDAAWSAYDAGLRVHDQITALDEQPLRTSGALMRALAQRAVGDRVTVTVMGLDGQQREFQTTLRAFPLSALGDFFALPYAIAVIYLGLGVGVFIKRWRESAGRAFAFLCALIALSLGLVLDLYTTHYFPRLWISAFALVGGAILHLALVFPQQIRLLNRAPTLRYLVYIPGIGIALFSQFSIVNFAAPRLYFEIWQLVYISAALSAVVFLGIMIYRSLYSESPIAQAQARIIMWGSLLAFGPISFWLISFSWWGWQIGLMFAFPWLALFPLSIAYAILRYRLFDINLIISRGVIYALLSAIVVGVYALFVYILDLSLDVQIQVGHPLALGVFVFLLAILLNPMEGRVQRVVERLFLGDSVDYRQLTRRFSNRLTETTNLPSVLEALNEAMASGWTLSRAALYLYDLRRGQYVPHSLGDADFPDVTFPKNSSLARQMLRQRKSLFLYHDRPLPPDLGDESEKLDDLRPALFVPIPNHGWLTLGEKSSGAPFSSDDLAALESLASQIAVALAKAELFTDLERRMTEVEVLRWVGQAVNFSMDVDDLLELIYTQAGRVLDTTNFYIALYNPEKRSLSFAFYVENGERVYNDYEWSVDTGLTGQIVKFGRAIVTDDYVRACRARGVTPGGQPGKAWMGAPLNAGDQIIGVMNVSSFDPAVTYSEDQLQFFSTIADQAAAILDKARLYREMAERARQLEALNEVGGMITSTLDLPKVLRLIMDKAVDLLQAQAGSLVLVDQDTGELVFEVTAGPGSADLVGMRLPPGTGILGAVVQDREPALIQDAQTDRRWYKDLDEAFVTHSVIAVPMVSRGNVIGVIELLNRRDGVSFDEEDQRLLMAFATNAAVSIENARLFTQTDQALAARVEELSMMQRIDRELNATLDYDRVMSLTLDWAMRMTEADMGLVAVVVENEEGERGLQLLANKGYPEQFISAYQDERWPLDHGIIGRAVRNGEPELLLDVEEDPDYQATTPGVVAQLTAPIWCEDQIVGSIALESFQQGRLDEESLAFVTRLADHAAISITNARLFEQVHRANEAKTEFISFVSHELKQPMTSMRGYTDLLAQGVAGELNEGQRGFLNTIRSNVERMDTLVSSLLDISRIESGRIRIELGDVSVAAIIEEALHTIRAQIETKRQSLAVDIAPDLPLVRGDRSRLVQVMTNLLSNAHKYTPEGGRISVSAQRDQNGFVACSVADTGVGMSPADQERLFTKYFRSDDPSVQSEPGTGLGLVITKSLVELQGGEIWVESERGVGSTFTFTAPVVESEAASA